MYTNITIVIIKTPIVHIQLMFNYNNLPITNGSTCCPAVLYHGGRPAV